MVVFLIGSLIEFRFWDAISSVELACTRRVPRKKMEKSPERTYLSHHRYPPSSDGVADERYKIADCIPVCVREPASELSPSLAHRSSGNASFVSRFQRLRHRRLLEILKLSSR